MNTKIYFGKNDIRFFYYRFKDSKYYSLTIILSSIIVSILLIVNVIIPQIDRYFSVRGEVLDLQYKIKTIKENITLVSNLDKTELDSQLGIFTKSLPGEKDFSAVLNTLNDSALSSGVTLGDYKFAIGSIVMDTKTKGAGDQLVSSVDMTIVVLGSVDKVRKFLKKLYERYPISEITAINYSLNLAAIDVKFYYKPYPNAVFKEDDPISNLTASDKQLFTKLSTWKSPAILPDLSTPVVGTSSSVPLFE